MTENQKLQEKVFYVLVAYGSLAEALADQTPIKGMGIFDKLFALMLEAAKLLGMQSTEEGDKIAAELRRVIKMAESGDSSDFRRDLNDVLRILNYHATNWANDV